MANPPPVIVTKKRGLGCCGCGCLILGLLAILLFVLGAGISYVSYNGALKVTSDTPGDIPTFDSGDDAFNITKQKLSGFAHDVQNHVPATVQLSADEINTMIARDPDFTKNNIHVYVSLTGDQARLQASLPTGLFTENLIKDRFLNADVGFGLNFDPDSRNINLDIKSMRLGQTDVPEKDLPILQTEFSQVMNQLLQKDPQYKAALDQVSSLQIKDSQLVIETK